MAYREYSSNSRKSKEEAKEAASTQVKEKKIKPVVSGGTKTKKNYKRKISDIFVSEDIGNVGEYLFSDIFVPAVKNLVSNVCRDGMDMLLYGKTGSSRSSRDSKVSYRDYYSDRDRRHSDRGYSSKSRFDYDDIIFKTRGDAERVRREMIDTVREYGLVTIGDMYDMADMADECGHTAYKYGWTTNIERSDVERVREGYILKLPKAMPID